MSSTLTCDAAIIGGGFGAIAAAIALTDRGHSVILTDEFAWIGGQVTSQALCVLDELYDPSGETVLNRRYADFRERIRTYYQTRYHLSDFGRDQLHFSPGSAACSSITAEPNVAYAVILDMLKNARERKLLQILPRHIPIAAKVSHQQVTSVTCRDLDGGNDVTIHAKFFLDGTETGDTYPLLGLPYRLGCESQSEFGEPHAPAKADASKVQSFTYCFMVEFVPGGRFTIPKPEGYAQLRDSQPFFLNCLGGTSQEPGKFFKLTFRADGSRIVPFWYYRSIVDHRNFEGPGAPFDRAVINVVCNDYDDESFVDHPDKDAILCRARQLSLAYLYWLQTEAPRDDGGGVGYPEIRALHETTGTPDGIAQGPYVREGRRLKACQTIIEQDISTATNTTARARHFNNSVGLGCFLIDIHQCSGRKKGAAQMTRPFQIPLGALVAPQLTNFAVANKGIGVTQITNGAYRLHPAEWAIGEAAGELAAYCLDKPVAHPNLQGHDLFAYQRRLLSAGIPLYWYEDLSPDHPAFEASQLLALTGLWPGDPNHLRFEPHQSICRHRPMFLKVLSRLAEMGLDLTAQRDQYVIAHDTRKSQVARSLLKALDAQGWPATAIAREVPEYQTADFVPLDPAKLW